MLTDRPGLFRMLLEHMRGRNGERSDRNRSSHEEEGLVHHDSQSDAQTNQQCHSRRIDAAVISSDCLHNISFADESMTAYAKRRSAWIAFSSPNLARQRLFVFCRCFWSVAVA
jgi:hypothetical protein